MRIPGVWGQLAIHWAGATWAAATAATNGAKGDCGSNGGGGGGGAYGIIVVKSPSKTVGGVVTPTAH